MRISDQCVQVQLVFVSSYRSDTREASWTFVMHPVRYGRLLKFQESSNVELGDLLH